MKKKKKMWRRNEAIFTIIVPNCKSEQIESQVSWFYFEILSVYDYPGNEKDKKYKVKLLASV